MLGCLEREREREIERKENESDITVAMEGWYIHHPYV